MMLKTNGQRDYTNTYPDKLREELSTHRWVEEDLMKSGWYMNDGSGTWQGAICR